MSGRTDERCCQRVDVVLLVQLGLVRAHSSLAELPRVPRGQVLDQLWPQDGVLDVLRRLL